MLRPTMALLVLALTHPPLPVAGEERGARRVDTDRDGLSWLVEAECGSDPARADTDLDGLGDYEECAMGFDPREPDSDQDGVEDLLEYACVEEYRGGTPEDRDGDGIPDSEEGSLDTDGDLWMDFCDQDLDGDSIPDAREPQADSDCDGIDDIYDPENLSGPCEKAAPASRQADTGTIPYKQSGGCSYIPTRCSPYALPGLFTLLLLSLACTRSPEPNTRNRSAR